jgi:hypothetical protein
VNFRNYATAAAIVLVLPLGGIARAQESAILALPAGSAIELMVLREVDSDRAKPGDPVKLRVNSPVKVGEIVVVPVGAAAQGEVTASKKSGMALARGKLAVKLTSITLSGQAIALGTDLKQRAIGGKDDDFWKAILAPEWLLFARGNSAKLKAGELLTAEVAETVCFATAEGGYVPAPCPGTAGAPPKVRG